MRHPKASAPPLARSAGADVLDWDHVERSERDVATDGLGLSTADRRALGLSAPRSTDLQAPSLLGAEAALADVLARGGAVAPSRAREPYAPSDQVGRTARRKG